MKIGAITVGQSPRTDVTPDLYPILGEKVEILEKGALDGLTDEEIQAFQPEEGDYVLVSRLRDGRSVTFAEKHILSRIQTQITSLQEEGVELILFLCSGNFPVAFQASIPLLFPKELLGALVPLFTVKSHITVLVPSELQILQASERWRKLVDKVDVISASPYKGIEEIHRVKEQVKASRGDLIVLDCIGYTQEMKEYLGATVRKKVILPRTLAARIITEITDR
ncbi:AroM family protein [Proteiniclasticum sp. SCR006]|uniref:AroM family protein n=1 Tax=Proteiniclasticum aestuarii TaxID=2817862 RepID=A0A939H9S6_9CLOT|nr:AroM family protein [Proteiniclasticum aestuarii]MBO1265144.1 AroM family protein [Proteiniclasticum aestuarii]